MVSKVGYQEVRNPEVRFEIGETSSSTRSIKENLSQTFLPKSSSFTSSINIFKDGEVFLQNSVRKCNGVLLQGPRRLMKLCLFGLLFPVLLISIPLYVRLILYPPFHYMMAPTDQRLLDQTSSSIWCQGQTVHMNGSFNAYLLPDTPRTKSHFSSHSMLQHVKLKDDVKEYWGFFLQKGSIVSINICTRYDGGMLMIMRGVHNLRKCAWIGEEDSAEQDEDHKDTSNESGQVSHEFLTPGELLMEVDNQNTFISKPGFRSVEKVNLTSEERRQELDYYIKKVLKLSKSKKEIFKELKKHQRDKNKKNKKMDKANYPKESIIKIDEEITNENDIHNETSTKREKLDRVRRYLEDNTENEINSMEERQMSFRKSIYMNVGNSSYEVSNTTRELYLNLLQLPKDMKYERGNINQSFIHDRSNEEHRSSFSSSEEALTKCEGLIGILPLYPNRKCHEFSDIHTNRVTYKIPVTGTYYFVFSSDNEVFDLDMYFNMTLNRVVFDTASSKSSCVNQTNCSLAFAFWSHDQAVVEVPEGDWNSAYTMEIKCQPRVAVYLLFLFLIPIFILFCALR